MLNLKLSIQIFRTFLYFLWFCLLFVAFSGVFTYAAHADITGITVALEDNTASTNTKYTVEFTTGAQVPKNGRIRITFPAGTGIPGTWSAAAVHVNGVGASTVTTSDSTVIIKVNEKKQQSDSLKQVMLITK